MSDPRFTLRSMMGTIAALGLVLGLARWSVWFWTVLFVLAHSMVWWGIFLASAFGIGWACGPAVRGRPIRVTAWTLVGLIGSTTLYLAWGHHRTMFVNYNELDHGFPYPDRAINALERWFDARYFVGPGLLKLHGEYPRVGFTLGILTIAFTTLTGLLVGLLTVRPGGE